MSRNISNPGTKPAGRVSYRIRHFTIPKIGEEYQPLEPRRHRAYQTTCTGSWLRDRKPSSVESGDNLQNSRQGPYSWEIARDPEGGIALGKGRSPVDQHHCSEGPWT